MTDVREKIICCIKTARNISIDAFFEWLDEERLKAAMQATENGIGKTISALYEARVEDIKILSIVARHWELPESEVQERLICEKGNATIRALEQYLKLKGMTNQDIENFMRTYHVRAMIRHEPKLWSLREKPERLSQIIKDKMKSDNGEE